MKKTPIKCDICETAGHQPNSFTVYHKTSNGVSAPVGRLCAKCSRAKDHSFKPIYRRKKRTDDDTDGLDGMRLVQDV